MKLKTQLILSAALAVLFSTLAGLAPHLTPLPAQAAGTSDLSILTVKGWSRRRDRLEA